MKDALFVVKKPNWDVANAVLDVGRHVTVVPIEVLSPVWIPFVRLDGYIKF